MKLLYVKNYAPLYNLDKYSSAVLRYNGVNEENLHEILPDVKYSYSLSEYYKIFEPLQNTDKAYELLTKLGKNKNICVIGDYDCDGILGTTIMVLGLAMLGYNCSYIIPDRFKDGYGMKKHHIDDAITNGADLIITVDNGIACSDGIDYLKTFNKSIIVTDHHIPKGKINADVVMNPYYNDDKFEEISGATVAFKFIYSLFLKENLDVTALNDLAALAGITTLSDVMPMVGENRILYKATMNYCNEQIKYNSFIFRLCNLLSFYIRRHYEDGEPREIRNFNKTNVDFYLSPVINALNRVSGDVTYLVSDIIEIFYQESTCEINYYARINEERKAMKAELLDLHVESEDNIVVEAFPLGKIANYSGISGLVASTIVEEEKKPAIVGIVKDDLVVFSGRSIPGFSLYNLLDKIKNENPDLDLQFGGHDEALGGAISKKNFEAFKAKVIEEYSSNKEIIEDEYFCVENTNMWLNTFTSFAPFGNKFELPLFYIKGDLKFLKFNEKWFSLYYAGNDESIYSYSSSDLKYLMYLSLHRKEIKPTVEAVLEICYNDRGEVIWKLVKILNKDPIIEEKIKNGGNSYAR